MGASSNNWIRQSHRLLSIVFTLTVVANFIARAQGVQHMGRNNIAPLFAIRRNAFHLLRYALGSAYATIQRTI